MLQKASPRPLRRRSAPDRAPISSRHQTARIRLTELEPDALIDLAEQLDGAMVPGVTLTEAEFTAWCPETLRAEWVDGRVILMSPSNVEHDDLSTWFVTLLRTFTEERDGGRVFHDVFVRFAGQRRRRIPDLMVVAHDHLHQLRQTHLDGAPDLLIEIVSPDSQSRDRREKYLEYEKAGVREYWIVDPLSKTVEVSRLERKKFQKIEEVDGVLYSSVLKGFRLKTAQLWLKPLPKVSAVLKWMNRK